MNKTVTLFKTLRALFMLFTLLSTSQLIGQQKVNGKVTDAESGEPLIGVNIVVVGNETTGTITDFDGNFALETSATDKELKFSYIGYESLVQAISTEFMDVSLKTEGELLKEIVVVGYGTQKTKEVTSSITSVKAEDFNKGNIQSPAQLLQGKVAGLSIAKAGGDPNAGFDIRLRGLSTFGANTSPLVIIDGVPGASLETVDPQDIESVNVLKDASAAAIYGTRAASGVIIITTKKGQEGTVKAEYNAYVSSEQVARKPDVLTAEEYLSLEGTTDYGYTTDWFDEMTQNAISQTHNLTLSGGNTKSNYRISANYRKGNGVVRNTGFDQLNARINFNTKALNDRMDISFNVSNTVRNEDLGVPEALGFAIRYNPTAPVTEATDDSEKWGGYFQRDAFGFFNPVAALEQNIRDKKKKRLLISVKGDYELLEGLKAGLFYSQTNENDLYGEYYSKRSYWTPYGTKNDKGFAGRFTDDRFNYLLESTLKYNKEIKGLSLNVLGGYSFQEFLDEGHGVRAGGFISDGFGYNNIGAATDVAEGKAYVSSYKHKSRLIAFFGRASLSYKDTYFATATVRREGSSKFGVNNKWGTFPGVSGGVNVTNLVNIPGVDRLKVRAGYGVTGNTPSETNASFLKFGTQDGLFYYQGQYINAYGAITNPNPDLKWETKEDINVGMDIALLDYKLNITADYFQSKSSDLLLWFNVRVPPNLVDTKLLNLAEMSNAGFEFSINTSAMNFGAFSWTPNFTFTKYIKTTLDKITSNEVESDGVRWLGDLGAPFLTGVQTIKVEEGQPIGQIAGLVYTGLDENGLLTYQDTNESGSIETKDDAVVLGNGLPGFQFGFNNTFTYKNFDLNFFVRGVFGHSLLNVSNVRYGVPASIAVQNGMAQALDYLDAVNGPIFSDIHVEDASYVKLDNVSLGYNIPMKGKYFSKIRLYATAQNLLTITNYSGVDPEVRYGDSYDGNNPLAPGLDRENTYFSTRGYTFGVNVSF